MVLFLPDDGIGIVVLVNADDKGPAIGAVMERVFDDMLGIKANRYLFFYAVLAIFKQFPTVLHNGRNNHGNLSHL
jgi:hypothetical protein